MILTRGCAKYMLPFLQAYADGKVVKGRHRCDEPLETLNENSQWERFCEFKIENAPREFLIEMREDGVPVSIHFGWDSKTDFSGATLIKVREITE